MDILAHTLWTNAAAREANAVAAAKGKKFHISAGWAAFWGIFPDLFAFSIPFTFRFYNLILGNETSSFFFSSRSAVDIEGMTASRGFSLAHTLYQYSHSLVIWAVVFIIIWMIFKRPRYELLGWALHILIDIPSHTLSFFPTPFLFPISDYNFPYGLQWSNYWFMIINYGALLLVWGRILLKGLFAKKPI